MSANNFSGQQWISLKTQFPCMTKLHQLPASVFSCVDWQQLAQTSDGSSADIRLFSNVLKKADAALERAFHDGVDTNELVRGRAIVIDYLLQIAWQAFGLKSYPNLAVIAVGGYGRGELHPHSDIDLLFLLEDAAASDGAQQLSRLLTFLWDIGLPVGHSTRTVGDCVHEIRKEITIATNLLEARFIAGHIPLYKRFITRCAPSKLWSSQDYFTAKLVEQKSRHHKYGDTAYRLEPNIKESPGGLRDIQTIGWIAKHHWRATTLEELVEHQFLTEKEYQHLIDGQTYLWRVRFALHLLAGKSEDRLLFDHQCALAAMFGYTDKNNNLAVEQFMQRYYRTIMELERLNEMLLQLFQETILYGNEPAKFDPICPRFAGRFQARNGFLEVTNERVFEEYPLALLEVFLILEMHPELKGVRASTIRLIRDHRHLINDEFRSDKLNRKLFMELLRQHRGITREFRRMSRYGILAAYWPSFDKVVGRMQYDLFHVYTVDEHTLFVLRNIRGIIVEDFIDELPLCSQLIKQIPKLEILYLAALFHDIAKGRKGDHSELGAEEAETFCLHHGLSHFDAHLVSWLVKNHLVMSLTSQRMDIRDPEVINDFARKVSSIQRLNYLYLLTVADIRATNPKLWNGWRDALLGDLYRSTQRLLRRGLNAPFARDEIITEAKTNALQILTSYKIPLSQCEQFWQLELDDDYFLRHSADEIAWHTQSILEFQPHTGPKVMIRQFTARGSSEIFIYTRDHQNLFAHTATVLNQQCLDILDARIYTTRTGYALDTFLVLDESGTPVKEDYRIQEITHALVDLLRSPQRPPVDVARRVSRHLLHFDIETRINFDNESGSGNTQLELTTADYPGLLSKVGKAFIDSKILVDSARISTLGARAEDIFYITDTRHHPITSIKKQQLIRQNILKHLNEIPGFSEKPTENRI